ncbi:hemerythrin domain-containing protein [Glaciimonas immobilis]|uniref:Hemerythrin superfamily protein n=1 Tax=Glaciimonas immobilis TaxID=728004 RepID=A0A840S0P0_9BURK|nr:hemerythrin domain-containing protein [Glaciimonas immobilis]KAF3996326.1 hemerythrin domain-containing protein [Glaciimonas immobilis]MBB5202159.1 hemerythrin superfamily protein [Glaciimonas immobilis]
MNPVETNHSFIDAIAMLVADHENVKAKFQQIEKLDEGALRAKKILAEEICAALTVHCIIEEEIFYPAARDAAKDGPDLVNEAIIEHASAKELIEQIKIMEPDDELFDAKVKVLSEQIAHHVLEEETEMFPQVKKSQLNLVALRDQMLERKKQMTVQGL